MQLNVFLKKKEKISDEEVVKLAKKEKRIIVTHDLDFGEIYYFREEGKVGILVLRIKNQTIESTNKALERFFKSKGIEKPEKSLIVLRETSCRIHRK